MIIKFKDVKMYQSSEESGSVAFDIYPSNKKGQYLRIAPIGIGFLDGSSENIKIIGVDIYETEVSSSSYY